MNYQTASVSNSYTHPITRALQPVLHGICREKGKLDVSETLYRDGLAIKATAALDDYRILVGKGGRTVNALQRLMRRAGERAKLRESVFALATSETGNGNGSHEFVFNPDFNDVKFSKLLKDVCAVVGIDTGNAQIQLDPDKKVRVFVQARNLTEQEMLSDIGLIFFSLGYSMGRRVDVKAVS